MEYQSCGRGQRPKGANIKQALKVMLVLAFGAWLLYQIKNSINNTENYGTTSLGRKGTPSRLYEIAFPDSGNVDSSGANEDMSEEEFGHINEKFSTREGKKVEDEPESQPEVSSKKEYKDSDSRRSESSHKENGKRLIINDSKSNDKEKEVQLRIRENGKSDFSEKGNDGGEEARGMQKNVVEDATNSEVTEEIDEVQSFHDENGVPPDVNETEIVFSQAHIVHEENISNVSEGSLVRKHIYEVTYVEDNTVEVNLEATKNDADEEINTGSITHVDTSERPYFIMRITFCKLQHVVGLVVVLIP
ncbi:hypothetical protein CR513_15903, partial [Mucuna pruriens]